MAGDAGKTGADQSTEKSSIGFSLPFAERAPANPMEVMAVATAAGMALTTQFANAFFGMMQAAMDATGKPARAESPAAPVVQVAETVKAEVKPEPVVVAKAAAPVAEAKPAVAAKPVATPVAKVAKPKPAAKAVAATDEKPAVKAKAAKAAPVAKAKAEPAAAKPAAAGKTAKAGKATAAPVAETPAPVAAKPQPRKKAAKAADDLKKISGIGPKLVEMLGGMGVTRFAEIAAWTDKDVEHFDRELGLDGRIAKDNWIAQAKALLR
ncbi:5' DNA nuclease [Rhizobium sp. SL86]|uniref:5' DNA nuclease n=1 Tax=Rhizobium sp. SL86 TaxID=2995148 RepID=UPI0022765889|nr:5' DNA nuclease [Rhizobium sp. SL86]MCY1663886.1 5' DNA nuclease [Rhizobium sp. SL86]